jgi:hypothetical protein
MTGRRCTHLMAIALPSFLIVKVEKVFGLFRKSVARLSPSSHLMEEAICSLGGRVMGESFFMITTIRFLLSTLIPG